MEGKLIYVETAQHDHHLLLDSEYLNNSTHFVVPCNETQTLEAIIRSLSYQYFQNSVPLLTQKILQFAFQTLNHTFSLTLLKDIFKILSEQHHSLQELQQYFVEMNREFANGQQEFDEDMLQFERSCSEDKDYLFQLAEQGQIRRTRLLEQTDFFEELQLQCGDFVPKKTITAKTQQTAYNQQNPEQNQQIKPVLEVNNILSDFYSAQIPTSTEPYKKDKSGSDSSKEISRFERRANNLIHQKNITRLVIDEMKRDLNRQIELGKQINRHRHHQVSNNKEMPAVQQDNKMKRYNKLSREKLMQAKMKKKNKK